jgi:GNAT superfamily N-acetyltransferase
VTTRIRQVDALQPHWRDLLKEMHHACFREEEFHPALFETGYWWIATVNEVPAAFAGLHHSVRWSDAGYLVRVAVLPHARGRGLQKRLIRVRASKARRLGMNWLLTDTRRNPASANSLIEQGFRMYQPQRPWGLRDSCYWRKRIT